MDELDAAEHWLRGYLAGRQGMAPEKHLLEEAAKAGHKPNTLHYSRPARPPLDPVPGHIADRVSTARRSCTIGLPVVATSSAITARDLPSSTAPSVSVRSDGYAGSRP